MHICKSTSLAVFVFASFALPSLASVTVSSPVNGADVTSPFALSVSGSNCSSQPIASLGYSLDSSAATTIVNATSLNAQVPASTGAHTLHVKSWGTGGAACVTDVDITVTGASAAPEASTNSDGITVSSPGSGATVAASFNVAASASTCSSQAVASLGYSIDSGATSAFNGKSMSATATASAGAHTLHVKSWGTGGAGCSVAIPITVSGSSSGSTGSNGITVTDPANKATVGTTFSLVADAATCNSQSVAAMGYSLDSGATTVVDNTVMGANITTSAGAHTLHVKSWGNGGAGCDTDVAITAQASGSSGTTSNGITVTTPANGATVSTSFSTEATASSCSSQSIASMGYSLDSGGTTTFNGSTLAANVSTSAGAHTLHVKSWGTKGSSCATDVAITAGGSSGSSGGLSVVPSNAVSVSNIQTLGNWIEANDPGNGGSSSGSMNLVGSPTLAGSSRQFNTSYKNAGGERYYVSFGDDTSSTSFLYDAWVYVKSPSADLANVEMDMNQTMSNGQTVIFGFECDGYNSTWDYTKNSGSASKPVDTWVKSGAYCNPRDWSTNTWHHVQVYYSRTSAGVVTYHTVWLDGAAEGINATVNSAFALGWAPTLLTNFQVDGVGSSGSSTLYLDEVRVYRW